MASIRRRKDRKGGWIVDCRDVPGGRRVTVATREQAELLRSQMVQEAQQAMPSVEDPDITTDAYTDRWLEQIGASVDPGTLASYRDTLRLHIRPTLGKAMLRSIHRGHIKALLAKKRGEGLSKNSVRLIRATLSVMLGDAVDDGILRVNPALGIARKGRKTPDSISQSDRKKKIRPMDYPQLATLVEKVNATCSRRGRVLFLLLADAGVRPGEACGVQWTDFDAVGQRLRIERAITKTGRVKGIKTGEDRDVDLSPRLVAAMVDLQAALEAEAMLAGKDSIDPWVFATKPGTPPSPHRVAKTFRKVLALAGLPHFRLYDLRHTYASHLIEQGADIAYVSRMMGHAKMTTTLLFYAHWFKQGDRTHIERMERVRAAAAPLKKATAHDDQGLVLDPESVNGASWHHFGPTGVGGVMGDAQVTEIFGEPSRDRTEDPLIKSQVLCQLS